MPSFDARTVVIGAFLMNSLMLFVLFSLYRGIPRILPGLREGVLSAFGFSLGSGLICMRGAIPDFLSVLVGNLAISGAIWMMYIALQISTFGTVKPKTWIWMVVITGFYTLSLVLSYKIFSQFILIVTGYNGTLFLICSSVAWRAKVLSFATCMTIIGVSFGALVSGGRFIILSTGIDAAIQGFDLSIFQKIYFALIALSVITNLLGFTMTTYERLHKMLYLSNATLEFEVAARTADLQQEIARKQQLEQLVTSTAEIERRRIGNELHDDLGQRLTGISLIAEVLANELSKTGQMLASHAETIQRAASEAIVQVRGLAHGLIPVAPEPEGFSEALTQLANASSVPSMVCTFEFEEPVDIRNQDVATNLYRIAQEAISNVIHHAKASSVTLRLDLIKGKVHFSITDNGCGFLWPLPSDTSGRGRGMGIMEFRASIIHYRLNIVSSTSRGSMIEVVEC